MFEVLINLSYQQAEVCTRDFKGWAIIRYLRSHVARDSMVTGKSLGGGVCHYEQHCDHQGHIMHRQNIELVSVSLRPFYLPGEILQIFVTVAYIHPKADVDTVTRTMAKTLNWLQGISPDAPNVVMGNLNSCMPGNFYE